MKGFSLPAFHGTFLLILQLICLVCAGVEKEPVVITELRVPTSVQNGTEQYITLDCHYELVNNDTTDLVVTWHLNSTQPIYQWIYGKEPQALNILRDRLDLGFNASKVEFEVHRALRISRPTTELSGDYTCRVSSIAGFALKQARMIVYVPASDLEFNVVPSSSPDSLNITCSATGVFPEPRLILSYGPNGENRLEDVETELRTDAVGAFDISVHKVVEESELSFPTHFKCDLQIPNTSYILGRSFIHRGWDSLQSDMDGGNTRIWSNGFLILTIIFCSFFT